jgi:hypothetical protein
MSDIILAFLYFIGLLFFFYTGEIILFLITFGRHKIETSIANEDREYDVKGFVFFEMSYYVGIVFWILVIIVIKKYIF